MSLDKNMRVAPTQARAKARVDSILAAARQHYEDVGRDHFNLDGVAEIAGCSVATIYRYFQDRVVLLDSVFPDRDHSEIKLAAIRNLQHIDGSAAEKWLATREIIQS